MDGAVFRMKLQWILENAGEFVDLVLMSGLDLEAKTALHIAVENHFEEAVKLLVSTGRVDLLATAGNSGWSALHTAVDLGDARLTQALLPIHNTAITPHCILSSLKQPTASPYSVTALHMAVRRNSAACAVVLLHTANALQDGHSSSWPSSEEEDELAAVDEIRQKHLFHGQAGKGSRKLNKLKDRNGDTPLHWAVKTNNYAMARLLCSYGARPRHSHNCQGQTPLVLAKYVLHNAKMTKLLAGFSPTSNTKTNITDSFENDNDDTEEILPLELPSPSNLTLQRVARASEVDGSCRKLQQTSLGVVMSTPPAVAVTAAAIPAKKSPSGEVSSGGSISARPYLHREAKSTIPQGPLDLKVESDTLETSRPRAYSLKVGRRELDMLRQKAPSLLSRPLLKRAVVHRPRPVSLKARRKASLMDPAEYYPMASSRRGICVVINNMTYWHPKFQNRGGCDKDEKRVERIFCSLGFLVKVLRNLSSGEMRSELGFIGNKTDHSAYDAFVAVIMTHGGLGELYGVNGDAFPVHQLTLDFTAERCPSLAASGSTEEVPAPPNPGSAFLNPLEIGITQVEGEAAEEATEDVEEKPPIVAAKLPRKQRLVPNFADFLLSYATLAGFKAQRDPQQGSIYIQTLCHHLEVYGRSRSLLDIVTSVHREVSEKVFREAESPDQEGTVFQQTPEVRHTLTRRVHLSPLNLCVTFLVMAKDDDNSGLSRSYSRSKTKRIHSSSSSESHSHNGLKNGTSKKGRLEEQRKKEEMKAEEERLTRQQWAESKLLEEEVARRLERYLEAELAVLLKEREVEFNAEVEKRVAIEREALEKRRKEEAERKAREEEEEKRRKEEEERQLKELNERLARQREEELSELRRKEEEIRQKQYEEELRKLEEKQRLEAEEQRRIKKEQEIILNRKRCDLEDHSAPLFGGMLINDAK
ncbi:Caspase-6 [Taenia crassiceps]|uniref:Caspase-6 n=1 Tax=Taenia crassiceps TaxID=6207 RepID=A0ABR4Q2E0_9CEST